MSAALTRDGVPSIVERLEDYGEVEADVPTIVEWCSANGVVGTGPDGRITHGDIRAARQAHKLPRFKAVAHQLNGKASEAVPIRAPVADAARPITVQRPDAAPTQATTSHQPGLPTSEADLIDMVTGYDGTVTWTITPEIAGWLLALNTNNRPMAPRAVTRFVDILKRGAWQLTGEPVIMSKAGALSDGQHRLTAIRQSGIPALCDIRFGIAREAFAATGTGARRTIGNVMAIAGAPDASKQAAIGRLIVQYDAGAIHAHNCAVDADLVLQATEEEPAIAAVAALQRPLKFKPAKSAALGLALVLAHRATGIDRVAAFVRQVDEGKAAEDDATRRLHVRLRDAAMERERLSQLDIAILTVRAWNAWINRRPIQVLEATEADRVADGFPKVSGG